jgi:hypothetical protein
VSAYMPVSARVADSIMADEIALLRIPTHPLVE